jgi:hypothetical protein
MTTLQTIYNNDMLIGHACVSFGKNLMDNAESSIARVRSGSALSIERVKNIVTCVFHVLLRLALASPAIIIGFIAKVIHSGCRSALGIERLEARIPELERSVNTGMADEVFAEEGVYELNSVTGPPQPDLSAFPPENDFSDSEYIGQGGHANENDPFATPAGNRVQPQSSDISPFNWAAEAVSSEDPSNVAAIPAGISAPSTSEEELDVADSSQTANVTPSASELSVPAGIASNVRRRLAF